MTTTTPVTGQSINEDAALPARSLFKPISCTESKPAIHVPNELWLTVLESPSTFPSDVFTTVMLNLIKNPNITSSHLFRADVFYDSENDHTLSHSCDGQYENGLTRRLKSEYQPMTYVMPEFELIRMIIRQLVPRNPQLDKPLVQTCDFFSKFDEDEERTAVVYTPHVRNPDDMPFYHPAVSRLAFVHTWHSCTSTSGEAGTGFISISYCLFQDTFMTTRLERTALRLLQTVHKHGQGQLVGYEKRVHHDQVIPQKGYQDTYARLKAKYGKRLSEQWVEVTDPGKHVFEDIGIAAFLIELWRDMYKLPGFSKPYCTIEESDTEHLVKPNFPGFVDVGCGNGILVYILLMEGYEGSGFDARERKTWHIFPEHVQNKLQQRLLVPKVLQNAAETMADEVWHDGVFAPGTFFISNHADELTAWTPLLAYLNQSSFIAIPCCSHDLTGARFRAPLATKAGKQTVARLPQQANDESKQHAETFSNGHKPQAAETGSLKRSEAQKKMPSAYSTLCSYVTSLAEELGFEPENEVLRIPSTRNQCIIGRRVRASVEFESERDCTASEHKLVKIVERETGKFNADVAAQWIEKAVKLAKKPGSGH